MSTNERRTLIEYIFDGVEDDLIIDSKRPSYTLADLKADVIAADPTATDFVSDLLRIARDCIKRKATRYEHTN